MMIRFVLLSLAVLSAPVASTSAQEGSSRLVDSINVLLAHASTDAIPDADRIELFLLRFDHKPDAAEDSGNAQFAIPGTELAFPIIADKELRGKECNRLIAAWRKTSVSRGGGAFCHVPKYGVRIYRGERLLLATTVSHECENFYLPQIDPETGTPVSRMTSFGGGQRELLKVLASYFR